MAESKVGQEKYNSVNSDKIKKMMEITYKVRSKAKIKWAVKAFRDWHNVKIEDEDCEADIMFSDIDKPFCVR